MKIENILGSSGRLISGSKSGYRERHPDNFAVFNANICTKSKKVWFGDLDLTLDMDRLFQVVDILGEDIYILYEMDARFENEDNPKLGKAIISIDVDHKININEKYTPYVEITEDGIFQKIVK